VHEIVQGIAPDSRVVYLRRAARHPQPGLRARPRPREDGELPDVYIAMGQTAENLADLRGVSRAAMDDFAARSQRLAEQAADTGFWRQDITPVTLPSGEIVSSDDGPRRGVTREKLAELKSVFRPQGTVTAGNSCPLNDGAAALVTSDTLAQRLGLT
jgi:acetyl-CoA C-acetyltransferase